MLVTVSYGPRTAQAVFFLSDVRVQWMRIIMLGLVEVSKGSKSVDEHSVFNKADSGSFLTV